MRGGTGTGCWRWCAGSAVNQDGASQRADRAERAVAAAGDPGRRWPARAVRRARWTWWRAHGTGTALGDPIEAQALLATYGQGRAADRPLWLGSVKSNIGHTQAAAGVAGVIKMVVALRHGVLPATLHVDEPSPHVDWSAGAVRLLTEAVPLAARRAARGGPGCPRSGSAAPTPTSSWSRLPPVTRPDRAGAGEQPRRRWPCRGGGRGWCRGGRRRGWRRRRGGWREFVAARPGLDPADVGWSLATTRSAFEHRAVVIGADRRGAGRGLAAVAAGEPAAGVVTGRWTGDAGRVVFVFPGQGAQWAGMGRELAASSPVFAARLAECGAALAPYVDWALDEVLAGADGRAGLDRADVVQPALWAVMVSLAAVWQAAGVVPDAVVGPFPGRDRGGVRGRDLVAGGRGAGGGAAQPGAGGAGRAGRDAVGGRARRRGPGPAGGLGRAAGGGGGERPAATVVSGEPAALAELAAACAAQGCGPGRCRWTTPRTARRWRRSGSEILAALAGITPGPARVPMVSAMTGQWLDGPEAGAGYWYDSLRAPVEFDRAVRVLAAAGHGVFVEVSPHPVLTAAITETLEDAAATPDAPAPVVTGTLRRDDGGPGRFLASLAEVHVRGVAVDWAAVAGRRAAGGPADVRVPAAAVLAAALPGRPRGMSPRRGWGRWGIRCSARRWSWPRARGWCSPGGCRCGRSRGWPITRWPGRCCCRGRRSWSWRCGPGTQAGCGRVEELTLEAPLVLPADGAVQLQVTVGGPDEDGRRPVEVYARAGDAGADGPWTRHASGRAGPGRAARRRAAARVRGVAAAGRRCRWTSRACTRPWRRPGTGTGRRSGGCGRPGGAGRRLRRGGAARGRGRRRPFGLHPALLDAALHAAGLASAAVPAPALRSGCRSPGPGCRCTRRARRRCGSGCGRSAAAALSLAAADGPGAPVVSVESLVSRPVAAGAAGGAGRGRRPAGRAVQRGVGPVPVPAASVPAAGGRSPAPTRWGWRRGWRWPASTCGPTPAWRTWPAACTAGGSVPDVVLACAGARDGGRRRRG